MTDEKTEKNALDNAIEGDVFRDVSTGEVFMVADAYDIPTVDLRVLWSTKPDTNGKLLRRIPIYHEKLASLVRMVEEQ